MSDEEIDPEILAVFLDESAETLAELGARFVALEADHDDRQSVDAIFRTVHTIKGNAAFFGLMRVKRLAHEMEDMLSLMRESRMPVTASAVSLLLKGSDLVTQMLSSVRAGESELSQVQASDVDDLVAAIKGKVTENNGGNGLPVVLMSLDQVLTEPGSLQEVRERLKDLRERVRQMHAEQQGLVSKSSRSNTPKSPVVELQEILGKNPAEDPTADEAKRIAELLAQLTEELSGPSQQLAAEMKLEHDRVVAIAGFVGLLREELLARCEKLTAGPKPKGKKSGPKLDTAVRTMRVEETKIDQFLDYVGELILVREMFVNFGKKLREGGAAGGLSAEYQRALEAFTLLSHSLQGSIMEVRKVSVRSALQKVPRMARDLAAKREKDVRVQVAGETVAVDKSLLESIEGPLTHMVRNAVDHGIEGPDEREKVGKPRQGTLSVEASELPDYVCIDVSDDGGGINAAKLRNKALRLGLINDFQAERMSDQDCFELLFAPGLSTAEKVTDISGRGVGMDVVRRNVTDLGGEIRIRSELGKGTTFSLLLPKSVTVQILDGFLVRVGDQRFVLPLQVIKESFRPDAEHVVTVADRGEYISRRGQVLPLMRFGRVLGLEREEDRRSSTEAIVVSVDVTSAGAAGLLVDEVLGVQQVVLREVHGIDVGGAPFTGGAVLGDGRVAMVVDVDLLAQLA